MSNENIINERACNYFGGKELKDFKPPVALLLCASERQLGEKRGEGRLQDWVGVGD